MRLRFGQLSEQSARSLSPVYLVCGDEPYQLGEAVRLVREQARRAGFDEREVLDQDGNFDWGQLAASAASMSLFSARKLIELRVSSVKLGKDGGSAVRAYCERPCPDNMLLIVAPALERREMEAQWVSAVDRVGAVVQVWPLKERELIAWLGERLRAAGLEPGTGVAELLAERVEGNQLAAAQEIEKLVLLREAGPLVLDDLLGNLADNARFDLFALTDAALTGERARTQRILSVLRGEGTAETLVLWVLARELRMLAEAADAMARRSPTGPVYSAHKVSRTRQDLVERALRRLPLARLRMLLHRCARIDRAIKGLTPGDPWQGLAAVADTLAGGPPGPRAAARL